jgi:hypothetical protein
VKRIIEATNAGIVVPVNGNDSLREIEEKIKTKMIDFFGLEKKVMNYNMEAIGEFSAENSVKEQVELFENAVVYFQTKKSK